MIKIMDIFRNLFERSPDPFKHHKLFGAKSFHEALMLNGFTINRKNDPHAVTKYFVDDDAVKEDGDRVFEKKGGIISLAVNVNAVRMSKNKIFNWIGQQIETIKNGIGKNNKIDNVISRNEALKGVGVTIGNFVGGKYKEKDGAMYDETSFSIEIMGIDPDFLVNVAEELVREFKQETVLVKDYGSNNIYIVKDNKD